VPSIDKNGSDKGPTVAARRWRISLRPRRSSEDDTEELKFHEQLRNGRDGLRPGIVGNEDGKFPNKRGPEKTINGGRRRGERGSGGGGVVGTVRGEIP
jgi:hypothetical protein